MQAKRVWVSTFDGASCRVYVYDRVAGRLHELPEQHREGPHKPHFDEPAGRVYASVGPGRSSVEPHTDPERLLEDEFVKAMVQRLAAQLSEQAFDELIVAAGPRALGAFRTAAPRALAEKVTREVHGNYVNSDQSRLLAALDVKTGAG